jgi:hypothetical protein
MRDAAGGPSLYRELAEPICDRVSEGPPETIVTKAIETVDEDGALAPLVNAHLVAPWVAGTHPPPDTVVTATIETIDNDRAAALFWGAGLPLS